MDRVLEEHSKLNENWALESVHDVRVALRRCTLIADVMRDLDPAAAWKPMRKAARRLFHQLGMLRDTQVLAEWVRKLGTPDEPSTVALLEELKAKYEQESHCGAKCRQRIRPETMANLVAGTSQPFPPRRFG
jgi:CHAD domain-containing protein